MTMRLMPLVTGGRAMPSVTVENYLKQLYLEQQRATEPLVSMGKLATAMNVVPGTATTMVKALADSGLVEYEPRGGVRLTHGGEQLALHVLRRHRLGGLFFVKGLGVGWSGGYDEAGGVGAPILGKGLGRRGAEPRHPP